MKQKHVTTLVAIVILVIWGLIFGFPETDESKQSSNTLASASNNQSASKNTVATNTSININASDDKKLLDSFNQKRSKVWMEVAMEITRLLPDDNEGSRHQKFIAESSSGHSVLISHNIDLADRVPVSRGDTINIRGRYEWTERGGVLHWTHHDPRGKKEGGWIEHDGQTYR